MDLPQLTRGRILDRYKRFFADIDVPGVGVVTAHCPNTGSMRTCWAPNAPAEISRSDNPKRKLKWTLERVDMGEGWIGVNTNRVNSIIAEGIERQRIAELSGYARMLREPACPLPDFAKTRLDIRLAGDGADAWVEIKNATLLEDGWIRFPDAVTERGRKHLEVLSALARRGDRAVLVFAINRPEGRGFQPAERIDPEYAKSLGFALESGVEVLTVRLRHARQAIEVDSVERYAPEAPA